MVEEKGISVVVGPEVGCPVGVGVVVKTGSEVVGGIVELVVTKGSTVVEDGLAVVEDEGDSVVDTGADVVVTTGPAVVSGGAGVELVVKGGSNVVGGPGSTVVDVSSAIFRLGKLILHLMSCKSYIF